MRSMYSRREQYIGGVVNRSSIVVNVNQFTLRDGRSPNEAAINAGPSFTHHSESAAGFQRVVG